MAPRPLSRRTGWLVAAATAGIFLALTLLAMRSFRRGHEGDFIFFYEAAVAFCQRGNLYHYHSSQGGFIYPPILAMLMAPLAKLSWQTAGQIWVCVNSLFIAGALAVSLRQIARRWPSGSETLLWAGLAATFLSLDKIRSDLVLGQTDGLVMLGFAMALVTRRGERRWDPLVGLLLGLAINIKYLPLIFLIYWTVRRRWSPLLWSLAGTGFWALLPGLVLGWKAHLGALGSALVGLSHMASGSKAEASPGAHISSVAWSRSISLPSAFARLSVYLGHPGLWVVLTGVLALLLVVLLAVLYRRRGSSFFWHGENPQADGMELLEWAGLILLALIFSPQTTSRHMVMLLPVNACVSYLLLSGGAGRVKVLAALVILGLGLILPPPSEALEIWRAVGGASWLALALCLLMIQWGLGACGKTSEKTFSASTAP